MWARIENNIVSELSAVDPTGKFHPSFMWVACLPNTAVGDTYSVGTFSKPAITLAQLLSDAQTVRISFIEQQYETLEHADIAYMATNFQADDVSRKLIAEVLAAQSGVAPLDFAWYDKNNSPIAMTNTQFQGLANAIYLRNRPLYINKQAKKAAIRAATTVAAVQAVVW